ncbi:hypothetical protein [Inquilinus sp. Marseille-Q2685]|uniref:hypothetical protein n=1 Tax=Inquilinus sp. Marseille-Q2685 TaxID=2866581 RepID=UPI001CE45A6E|nr:hypothetical protein [Inquilinus sp. Marseille-Q2685]
MGDRTARIRDRWLAAALLLAACGWPPAGAAADAADPVQQWQQLVRANIVRYACGAAPRDAGRQVHFAYAMSDARLLALTALAKRQNVPTSDAGVLADIDRRRAEEEKAARDVVAQRGCGDPQIRELIGLADRASN